MIRSLLRDLNCSFCSAKLPDEQFLYICDECGHAFCSDCSEWIKVDSSEKIGYTQPVFFWGESWHVRVCVRCINPGLTYEQWREMANGDEYAQHGLGWEGRLNELEWRMLNRDKKFAYWYDGKQTHYGITVEGTITEVENGQES
jgi:hypothetical protein